MLDAEKLNRDKALPVYNILLKALFELEAIGMEDSRIANGIRELMDYEPCSFMNADEIKEVWEFAAQLSKAVKEKKLL